jgi:two-component system chemotaxis response regulator CheB
VMRPNETPINATCPECRGPLAQSAEGPEFRCLVGHVYTLEGMLHAHYETQERTLWSAVLVLEETRPMVDALSPHLSEEQRERLRLQVELKREQARAIREILNALEPFRLNPG